MLNFEFYREEEGPSWYLAGGGWQGAYYYESGSPGESRAGAYLYPDYSTAVVGLWMDHLLLQVKLKKLNFMFQLLIMKNELSGFYVCLSVFKIF